MTKQEIYSFKIGRIRYYALLSQNKKVDKFLKLAQSKAVREGYEKLLRKHDATPETLPEKLREESP
jgi:hypothetical protein